MKSPVPGLKRVRESVERFLGRRLGGKWARKVPEALAVLGGVYAVVRPSGGASAGALALLALVLEIRVGRALLEKRRAERKLSAEIARTEALGQAVRSARDARRALASELALEESRVWAARSLPPPAPFVEGM